MTRTQTEVHDLLSRLVGDGAAALYRDGCRLLSEDGADFAARAALVGHCYREVEGALRDLAVSLLTRRPTARQRLDDAKAAAGPKASHLAEIKFILQELGLGADSPVYGTWTELPGDNGLHSWAHRAGLRGPRQLSDGLSELAAGLDDVFRSVLLRLEPRFGDVLAILKETVARGPCDDSMQGLADRVPHTPTTLRYLFDACEDTAWLQPLAKAGYFVSPPAVANAEGTIEYPPWDCGRYLVRMVSTDPVEVTRLLLRLEPLRGWHAADCLMQAALLADGPPARMLAARLCRGPDPLLCWDPAALKAGDLAMHLAACGMPDAGIDLVRCILAPEPPSLEAGASGAAHRSPRPRVQPWVLDRVIDAAATVFAATAPCELVDIVADALQSALDHSHDALPTRSEPHDGSGIWSPSLDAEPELGPLSLEERLARAVLRAARAAAEAAPAVCGPIVRRLWRRPWLIFHRLALHLATDPTLADHATVVELLVHDATLGSGAADREWRALAGTRSADLNHAEQAVVLQAVMAWWDRLPSLAPDHDAARRERADRRAWRMLASLKAILAGDALALWRDLSECYGPCATVDEPPSIHAFTIPSPKSPSELGGMTVADLVPFLHKWQPGDGPLDPGFAELGAALFEHVRQAPAHLAQAADRLGRLRPELLAGALTGWAQALRVGSTFDLQGVLTLACSALNPEDGDGRHTPGPSGPDEAALVLLDAALRYGRRLVPDDLSKPLWDAISSACRAVLPDAPTGAASAPTLQAASKAIRAAVAYVIWRCDHPGGAGDGAAAEEQVQPVLRLLEDALAHEAPDALPIWSALGADLDALFRWVPAWAERVLPTILPADPSQDALWSAAFTAYVLSASPRSSLLERLHGHYKRAIERWFIEPTQPGELDLGIGLAQHVLVLYLFGEGEPLERDLVRGFYSAILDPLRVRAASMIARAMLAGPVEYAGPARALRRVRALGKWRRSQLAACASAESRAEIAALATWSDSDRLPPEWAIAHLHACATIASPVEHCETAVARVARDCVGRELAALQCLEAVLADQPPWEVDGWRDHVMAILAAGRESPDEAAANLADALAGRLLSHGYSWAAS